MAALRVGVGGSALGVGILEKGGFVNAVHYMVGPLQLYGIVAKLGPIP